MDAQVRVSKWLKELEMMFYGSSLAYDKVGVQCPVMSKAALITGHAWQAGGVLYSRGTAMGAWCCSAVNGCAAGGRFNVVLVAA